MEKLKFIKNQMAALNIPYEFGAWTGKVTYPYFTGELIEATPLTEDGKTEAAFILTGFHKGTYLDLEQIKEKIKNHFDSITGYAEKTAAGVVVGWYDNSVYIPQDAADLKVIQINLILKEWKGA